MTAPRTRKQSKTYDKYLKTLALGECQFCDIKQGDVRLVAETPDFKIIHNIFPYSMWDSQRVADHLLIVPKQHTNTLRDLTPEQSQEFVRLISDYESNGYNVYARAPSSRIKTVVHQHTHLIKPLGKPKKLVLMIRRPYIRITF